MHIQTSDEFNEKTLPPMWEWNHNPDDAHWSLTERKGSLRLHPLFAEDLLHARDTLTETMQDESLTFTARLDVSHMADGDHAGVSLFDKSLSYVAVKQLHGQRSLLFSVKGNDTQGPALSGHAVELQARLNVDTVTYFYSVDGGRTFMPLGDPVKLAFSWWKGARPALFAFSTDREHAGTGYIDFDWAHYRPVPSVAVPDRQK